MNIASFTQCWLFIGLIQVDTTFTRNERIYMSESKKGNGSYFLGSFRGRRWRDGGRWTPTEATVNNGRPEPPAEGFIKWKQKHAAVANVTTFYTRLLMEITTDTWRTQQVALLYCILQPFFENTKNIIFRGTVTLMHGTSPYWSLDN